MGKFRDAFNRFDSAFLRLEEKVDLLIGEKEELKNKYLRAEADKVNLKKRFEKEKSELKKFANEELIKELLPVVDAVEKSIKFPKEDALIDQDTKIILYSLTKALEKFGLEKVEPAEGKKFDPNFHEAIYNKEVDDVNPGIVIAEFRTGYLLNGRLIRPSVVAVSKKGKEKKNE